MLFITGYAENAVLNHGHLDRGTQVLTKPFTMETLAVRIKDLVKRGDVGANVEMRPGDILVIPQSLF